MAMPRSTKTEGKEEKASRESRERTDLRATDELVAGFLTWLEVERNCSRLTVYEYGLDLARLSTHARNLKKKIEALTYQDLFNFLRSLRERHKCQARTLARKTAAVKAFY